MSKSFSLLFIGSLLSSLFSSPTIAQTPDVMYETVPNIEGKWKMSILSENISPSYTLIQKGNVITGTFQGPVGNLPLTGNISKDKKVNFSAKFGGMSLRIDAMVNGKNMKGIIDIPRKGKKSFTATKGE